MFPYINSFRILILLDKHAFCESKLGNSDKKEKPTFGAPIKYSNKLHNAVSVAFNIPSSVQSKYCSYLQPQSRSNGKGEELRNRPIGNPINSEIQYLKAILLDRGYNPSIVDKALFKFHPPHSNPNINIILPFFSNSSFSIAKIVKQYNFKQFSPQLINSVFLI